MTRIWSIPDGALEGVLEKHKDGIDSICFSRDGSLLFTGGLDGTVRIWDLVRQGEIARLEGHWPRVNSISLSRDGQILAVASSDKMIHLWDTSNWMRISKLEGHFDSVQSVAFSPTAERLVSAGFEGRAFLWDVKRGTSIPLYAKDSKHLMAAAFSDGLVLASDDAGDVLAWNPWTGAPAHRFKASRDQVHVMAVSSDQVFLATGGIASHVRIWELASMSLAAEIPVLKFWTWSFGFSPDGRWLAIGGDDGRIRVIDFPSLLWEEEGHDEDRYSVEPAVRWETLGADSLKHALDTMRQLAAMGDRAVSLLKLSHPRERSHCKEVERAISQLESDDPGERQRAHEFLVQWGSPAVAALQQASCETKDAEVKDRVHKIIARMNEPPINSCNTLRRLRSIQVLRQIGSKNAIQLLRDWAEQSPLDVEKLYAKRALDGLHGMDR